MVDCLNKIELRKHEQRCDPRREIFLRAAADSIDPAGLSDENLFRTMPRDIPVDRIGIALLALMSDLLTAPGKVRSIVEAPA